MAKVIEIETFGVENMKHIGIRPFGNPVPSTTRRVAERRGGVAISLDSIQFLGRQAVPVGRNGVVTPNGSEMAWLMQAADLPKSGEV
jgi:hypothetical protein